MLRAIAITLALVVASSSVSCAKDGAVRTDGPIRIDESAGTVCFGGAGRSRQTWSAVPLRNEGDEPVVLTHATLIGARNMKLIEAFLVERGGGYLGILRTYPPRMPKWNDRKRIPGAKLNPGEEMEFGVGLASTGRASARAVRVHYKNQQGEKFATRTHTKFVVQPDCVN